MQSRLKITSSLLAIMLGFGVSHSLAQEAQNAAMSQTENMNVGQKELRDVKDSLLLALKNNPQLSSARDEYMAVQRSQFVTFSQMLPQVTAFASQTYHKVGEDDPGIQYDEYEDDNFGVSVSYDLFTSGKNLNAYRSKRADVRAQGHTRDGTEQAVLLDAVTSHFDVLRDAAVLALNEKNLEVLNRQLRAVKDRFEVGVVTRTDVAQSEARVAGARSALIAAQTYLKASHAFYQRTVGVQASGLTNTSSLPELPGTLEEATAIARSENPTLNAAREGARGAKLTAYSQIGAALPQVKIAGSYTRYDNQTPVANVRLEEGEVYEVTATVSVPIFTGFRNAATISAARYAASALTRSVHATANVIDERVIVAWHSNLAANAVITARNEQIKASEIALEGVRQENTLGTRTILDVLDAEQALLDARVNLVRAQRDQSVAAYGLLLSVGRLSGQLFVQGE
jgi:outer membrane protein